MSPFLYVKREQICCFLTTEYTKPPQWTLHRAHGDSLLESLCTLCLLRDLRGKNDGGKKDNLCPFTVYPFFTNAPICITGTSRTAVITRLHVRKRTICARSQYIILPVNNAAKIIHVCVSHFDKFVGSVRTPVSTSAVDENQGIFIR